jgi:aspartyl-tRNA(Asn)/glutamyl-tRNA(Gln) amidotransferase subunit B
MNGDLARLMNAAGVENIRDCKVQPKHLRDLIGLVQQGTITGSVAKQVLEEVFQTGAEPSQVVQAKGLTQVSDAEQLAAWVQQAIDDNPDAAEKVRNGKLQTLQFLVGQVMKLSRGRANPNEVRRLIADALGVKIDE